MIKKIFKALLASIILIIIGLLTTFLAHLLVEFCPVLFVIITIIMIIVAGWQFANK